MKSYESINVQHIESEHDSFTEDRYKQFFKFFPENVATVLDLGCNTGRGGTVLKKLNNKLTISGLDVVEDRLKMLPESIYTFKINGSSTEIPVDDCSYDVVVAGEFIEHLYCQDVVITLYEVFRVLKIGGSFLLTTPNPQDIKRRFRKQSVLGGAHLSQHFYKVLKIQLMMTGFSNIRILGSGKMSRYLGYRFPLLSVYGSYMAAADKF